MAVHSHVHHRNRSKDPLSDWVGGSFSELRFIPGAVSENSVFLGAILEFGVIVTNIATAVVIYPIVKRVSLGDSRTPIDRTS